VTNEILSYIEMCQREGASLQRGMNYRLCPDHSVLLMSVRPNSPYADRVEGNGSVLIYEGHDVPTSAEHPLPKTVDQPECSARGRLSENGKFHRAAQEAHRGAREPERVMVYEKIKVGIWSCNGMFALEDSWLESDGHRRVFKFRLVAIDDSDSVSGTSSLPTQRRRIIPTSVKVEVWRRDGGKCVICSSSDELHFDHVIPYSKGGTSVTAANVQLLCARHNLAKSDQIS
jgi:hypothetical protein